jgi:MoxR-like ATPase
VLIEGVPGLGKTLIVRSVAAALGLDFGRVQCTPDMIPADVTGTNILVETAGGGREFRFQPGPIFSKIVLADEVNRATPKTQSAFLEAMEERQVTIAGQSHPLPAPFVVLATQNPIELEGTFPLPEAQLDRFMFKIVIDYPGRDALQEIGETTTAQPGRSPAAVLDPERVQAMRRIVRRVPVATEVMSSAVAVVRATHPGDVNATDKIRRFVRFGASPRSLQAMVLGAKAHALIEGRCHVSPSDLRATAWPAMRHRVLLNFEASVSSVGVDEIISELVEKFLR